MSYFGPGHKDYIKPKFIANGSSKFVRINMYNHDLEIKGSSKPSTLFDCIKSDDVIEDKEISKRSNIVKFSGKSRLRLIRSIRNTNATLKTFITLTYPREFQSCGTLVKSQLNTFLTVLRQNMPGVNYVWVLEFQERGAPHFHLIIDKDIEILNSYGSSNTSCLNRIWYNIVGSDDPKHLRHGVNVAPVTDPNTKALAGYMAKYFTKEGQKDVPYFYKNVGRFWGAARGFCKVKESIVLRIEDFKFFIKVLNHYYRLRNAQQNRRHFKLGSSAFIFEYSDLLRKTFNQLRKIDFVSSDDPGLKSPLCSTLKDIRPLGGNFEWR